MIHAVAFDGKPGFSVSVAATLSCRRRTNHATASVRRRYANAPAVCARCVHVKDQVRVAWKGGFSKGPPRFRSAVNGTALASVSPPCAVGGAARFPVGAR
ncbi:hypothetical protein HPB50_002295 [Hyalomma asiaticum]|uniref:Uncharacterized protein n=1 Tax=Hyalomma asiaticum TaxID=266040 RepID=A0ACB7RMC9_HYAAI|nr:hypothetical protein HPB50_002295 [Hyalomma asiaticum]